MLWVIPQYTAVCGFYLEYTPFSAVHSGMHSDNSQDALRPSSKRLITGLGVKTFYLLRKRSVNCPKHIKENCCCRKAWEPRRRMEALYAAGKNIIAAGKDIAGIYINYLPF